MKHPLIIRVLLLITILVLAFTLWYGIAYILATVLATIVFRPLFVFRTFVQRFVLLLLTLLAVIPLVGLVCWASHADVLPIYNLVGFLLVFSALYSKSDKRGSTKPTWIDKVDIVSLSVALLPVIILLISFTPAPNKSASLFQLASEGWDNGSHILMLEDNSSLHGYAYGPWSELKGKMIERFNGYPQAWHLATADVVNGFDGNRFRPEKPMQTILVYMVASIGWMVIASYLFVLCASRLYEQITNKVMVKGEILSVAIVSILFQIIVVYGSLASGFTNYIGSIVYLILLLSMVVEILHKPSTRAYVLAVIFGTTSVIIWFLTLPPVAITIIILLSLRRDTFKRSIRSTLKDWRVMTALIIGSSAMVLQIYIFQNFSAVGGSDQLNTGVKISPFSVTIGVFPVSQLLYVLVISITLLYCYKKLHEDSTQKLLLTILIPWILLVFGTFLYQNITVNYTSYYLSKVLGLSLIVSGITGSVIFSIWINKHAVMKYNSIVIPAASLLAIGLLVIGTGQSTYGLNKLFNTNARTSRGVSVKIAAFLRSGEYNDSYIIVLTDNTLSDGSLEDFHGKLEMRVVHQRLNCAYRITGHMPIEDEIDRLSTCADKLAAKGKSIIVITSNKTEKRVLALNKSNIIVRNTR